MTAPQSHEQDLILVNAMITRLNNLLDHSKPEKAEELIYALQDLTLAANKLVRTHPNLPADERLKLIAAVDNTITKVKSQEQDTKSRLKIVSNQLKAQKSYKQSTKK